MIRPKARQTTSNDVGQGRERHQITDMVSSLVWFTFISAVLVATLPELRRWFMVPTTICGALIASDLFPLFRGETDVFHPKTLFAIIGTHLFYTAPI
jgi:hypothetical protein